MSETPTTSRWLVALLFAGFFAGFTAAVWFTLDHFGVRLRQLGWPFSSVGSFALINGVGGFVFGRAYHAQQLRRAAAREDPVEDDETDEPADENLPPMPAFADRVAVDRRRAETVGDVTVDVFDLTTEASDGDGGTMRITRTIALLPAAGLPPFELRPAKFQDRFLVWAGAVGVEFDERAPGTLEGLEVVARFTAAYRLTVASEEAMISGTADADEEAVRRVFPLRTMRTVLGRPDWRVQSHGGYLACWEAADALGPKRRKKLVADAVALRATLVAARAGEAGEPVAAPPRVVPVRQQAARLQASLLGGVLGVFGGSFAAVLLLVGEVFGPGNMFAVFPLATVCGALLGATIGRLLPLRRPLLQKPKDARREKVVGCAGVVGIFGGFFVGGILGFILGELIGLRIDDHKPRALLFFGGIGAGAFLGPVVLGVTTNYLYQWITGRRDTNSKREPGPKS